MNLLRQELWVLLKRKTTIVALLVALIGTVCTAYLAINQDARLMTKDTIVEGKDVVLYAQQAQKKIEGRVSQTSLQQFLNALYIQNQQYPMSTDEKINYLFNEQNLSYKPYIKLLSSMYIDEKAAYAQGIPVLYEIGGQTQNIYQQWMEKVRTTNVHAGKEDLQQKLESLDLPFTFASGNFVTCALSKIQDLMLLIFLILSIILASLFSRDRYTKTDQIVRTTRFGKKRLRRVKCATGILFSCVTFGVLILLYNFIIGSQIGFTGLSTSIQMNIAPLSPYGFTAIQAYGYITLLAFVMCLFISMMVLLASDRTKKTYTVIVVSFILLFVAYMINSTTNTTSYFMMLLPFGLLEKDMIFQYCDVVVGGIHIWMPWIITCILVLLILFIRIHIVHRKT